MQKVDLSWNRLKSQTPLILRQPPHQIIQPCKIQQRLAQSLKLGQCDRPNLGFSTSGEGAHTTR
jgi:hypothetical protein